ncbi:hypothetical protein PACTADRAFT_49785 [Pachysolen tannophilus NRRL Y-2460]|uniref:Protein kinase domain-containing protein n=1 Tax=Pachysolen tannophilus NRRL Y-2460 TaxID=669874 RepID=A0A1E4TXH1_PACTA|nr:hypothetical protein PACTADRAFT_49785 [Pachysolen tannophilus NRRL Y-2460]
MSSGKNMGGDGKFDRVDDEIDDYGGYGGDGCLMSNGKEGQPRAKANAVSLNISIPKNNGQEVTFGPIETGSVPVSSVPMVNQSSGFSQATLHSVTHLPSPLVGNGQWDPGAASSSHVIDYLRDRRGGSSTSNGGVGIGIGTGTGAGSAGGGAGGGAASANANVNSNGDNILVIPKLRRDPSLKRQHLQHSRVISEFKSSDLNRGISAGSVLSKNSDPISSNTEGSFRNFSTPTTSSIMRLRQQSSEEAEGEGIDDEDLENITLYRDVYTAHDKNEKSIKYRPLKKIGRGNFSVVLLGEQLDRKLQVAIKISTLPQLQQTRSRVESSLIRELEILKMIDHPNIIKLLAHNISKDEVIMILPYCIGGDLYEFVSTYRSIIVPELIRKFFANLVSAVNYLHEHDIVHRDIKLENILLNFHAMDLLSIDDFSVELPPLITLTDFGLSKKIDPNAPLLTTRCGSEDYVSPELLMGLPYDGKKNDVWSLGVLLYSLMEGKLPFDPAPVSANSHISSASQKTKQRTAHKIALIDWDWYYLKDDTLQDLEKWEGAKKIVENCLVKKEKRITCKEIMQNEWVKDYL